MSTHCHDDSFGVLYGTRGTPIGIIFVTRLLNGTTPPLVFVVVVVVVVTDVQRRTPVQNPSVCVFLTWRLHGLGLLPDGVMMCVMYEDDER